MIFSSPLWDDPATRPKTISEGLRLEGGEPCSPMDLYRFVFRIDDGAIQRSDEPPGYFKTNPIIFGRNNGRIHRKILFADTFEQTLKEFSDYEWAFVSGCTYWGRVNSAERQSKLFAMIFDLDDVEPGNVRNFFSAARAEIYPYPNFVVESGHGLHLYYVIEIPVDLYPNIKTQLKELKYRLTRVIWNRYTSQTENPQYQGINQAFRIPGGRTKIEGVRAQAWYFSVRPINISELNEFVSEPYQVDVDQRWRAGRISLGEAKALYPDWYERIVVQKQQRRQWISHPGLYNWWLRKITEEKVHYGHRYFCIMALAIYAAKCGIYDREKVKADAMALKDKFSAINPEEPFTEADIDSALECLDSRYATFPRRDIAKLTRITIPTNKRNGRTRIAHITRQNKIFDLDVASGEKEKRGRPLGRSNKKHPKRDAILAYAVAHPGANHSEIARALGISRPTVIKWLRAASEEGLV